MTYVMLTWLADALRAEGCTVKETSGWKTRGRPSSSGEFNPYGVLWHHTGTTTGPNNPNPTLNMCINGRSDLPGPLCQVLIGYDGVCHIVAAGRANHGGACNGFGPFAAGDSNAQLVGWEIDYNGTQSMSAKQKDAATRASAACLKRWKRSSAYAARHAETSTTGKWDTGGLTGDQIRTLIKNYLDKDDEDMPLNADDLSKIRKIVSEEVEKRVGDVVPWPTKENKDNKVTAKTALSRLKSMNEKLSNIEEDTGGK